MKKDFVLDLNIIPHSWLGKNERGLEDYSSSFLLLNIIENCHRIIVNKYLLRKYSEKTDQVKRVHRGAKVLNAINVLHQAMNIRNKVIIESDILDINFPKGSFHDDDLPIVTLAARKHAILVTTDNNLIRKLRESSIAQSHSIKPERPEDAIKHAVATDI